MNDKIISKRGKTYKIYTTDMDTHKYILDSINLSMKEALSIKFSRNTIREKLMPAYILMSSLIYKYLNMDVTESELSEIQLQTFPGYGYYNVTVTINKPEFRQTIIFKISSLKEGCFATKECSRKLTVVGKTLEDRIKQLSTI